MPISDFADSKKLIFFNSETFLKKSFISYNRCH